MLEPGTAIERELTGSELHSYRIMLRANEFLHVVVEQKGIDVVVRVFGPDGKKLAEVDSPNGTQGSEPVSLVTEAAGNYRLEVRSLEKAAAAARYEVKIEKLRAATTKDKDRVTAQQLLMEAVELRSQGTADALRTALKRYEAVLPLTRSLSEKTLEATVLHDIGRIYLDLNDLEKALDYYNHALGLRQNLNDKSALATTLADIGAVHYSRGEMQRALDYYNQALALKRATLDRAGEAEMLGNIGLIFKVLGDTEKGLDYYNRTLVVERELGNRPAQGSTLNNIGGAYYSLGELGKARDYFEQALIILRAINDRENEAGTLNNLGEVYRKLGDFQRALDLYNQSLKLRRKVGDRRGEAYSLLSIGNVYGEMGEGRTALDLFQQSLSLWRVLGQRQGEGVTLGSIGVVYRSLGEKQAALKDLSQSISLLRAVGDRIGEANSLTAIGAVYYDLDERDRALEIWNQALVIRRAVKDRQGEANTLNNIASVLRTLGENAKAYEYLQQALSLAKSVGDRSGEAIVLLNIARVERARNNLSVALTHIEVAIQIIESLRSQIVSQSLRASYFATVQDFYELYIDLLMRLHKELPSEDFNAAALRASEGARARSLLELLTEAGADIRQGVDSQLLERERTLQQQLSDKAERQTRLLSGKHSEEQATAIRKELEALTTELQQVAAQIRQLSPRYAALTQPAPLSLKEIQNQVLDPETLLLEYALGEERSYLWAVTPNTITSYELPKRSEIEAAARDFYELLTARNEGGKAVEDGTEARKNTRPADDRERVVRTEPGLPDVAARLSQMVLSPVAAQLGTKRLLIVSDGALQYVPFAALPEPASVGGKKNAGQPLIVNHEIVSLPSASTLAVLRRELRGRRPAAKSVTVLADPVFSKDDVRVNEAISSRRRVGSGSSIGDNSQAKNPVPSAEPTNVVRALRETGVSREGQGIPRLAATSREASSILALAPAGAGMKAVGFAASRETATSEELARYRIVHFATHGLLNSEHPELSGVVLSLVDEGGQPQDGFLRLHEVYNLNLPVELVVLSACQTGLGKEIRGEGLVGLTRGFMYAGAKSVAASLWQVDDVATRELMERFYRAMLADGLRPAAALRRAQVEMLRGRRRQAPYYWAAFVLQGEWK